MEGYLVSSGEERATLLGGYVLEHAGEGRESRVEVSEPLIGPEYETALRSGARIFSAYQTPQGERVWIITEAANDQGARRSACILLPEEY